MSYDRSQYTIFLIPVSQSDESLEIIVLKVHGMVRFFSDFGQILVRFLDKIGQIVSQIFVHFGQIFKFPTQTLNGSGHSLGVDGCLVLNLVLNWVGQLGQL